MRRNMDMLLLRGSILLLVITTSLIHGSGSSSSIMDKCSSLTNMFEQMKNSTDYTIKCHRVGYSCSAFLCQFNATKSKEQFKVSGSFECLNTVPVYKINVAMYEKTESKTIKNNTNVIIQNNLTVSVDVQFSEVDKDGLTRIKSHLNISLSSVGKDIKFVNTLNVSNLICTCENLVTLESQVSSSSLNFSKVDMSCWATNKTCRSFSCNGATETPIITNFWFDGLVYVNKSNVPCYQLKVSLHFPKMNSSIFYTYILMINGGGPDTIINYSPTRETGFFRGLLVQVSSEFSKPNSTTGITKVKTSLFVKVKSFTDKFNQFSKNATFSLDFKGLNYTKPKPKSISTLKPTPTSQTPTSKSTQKPTPTSKSTLKPTPTSKSTQKPTPTSTQKPTPTSKSTQKPTPTSKSTQKPTPTSKSTSTQKPTSKSTPTQKTKSHPAKAVLIVLAILIILSVILVGIYFKRRRRLSDQPAYYNDIAINDPLHYEIDDEPAGDDDELPLFS